MTKPFESETDDLGFSHSSGTDDATPAGAQGAAAARQAAAAAPSPQRSGAAGVAARRGGAGASVGGEAPPQQSGEEADLREYGQTLGADLGDAELVWLVKEAFEAPLPTNWTEHVDAEGRLYFFNQVTEESTWSHPMDAVYRELIGLIQRVRAHPTLDQRAHGVREHLTEVHRRALANLDGWSGPYNSDTGLYYHNERLGQSTWASPIDGWEHELAVRHSVLHRSLLADFAWPEDPADAEGAADGQPADLLTTPMLQLPLGLARREDSEKSSARSFYTARESARSGASTVRSARAALASLSLPEEGTPVARQPRPVGVAPCSTPSAKSVAPDGAAPSVAEPGGTALGAGACAAAPREAAATPKARSASGAGTGDAAAGEGGHGDLEVTFGSTSALKMPVLGRGAT